MWLHTSIVLLLSLSGVSSCDTVVDEPTPTNTSLAGVWQITDAIIAGTVVSGKTQEAVDGSVLTEGQISSGALADPLRYLQIVRSPFRTKYFLGSESLYFPERLELDNTPPDHFAFLFTANQNYSGFMSGAIISGYQVDLSNAELVDSGDTLRFSGMLTGKTKQVEENSITQIGRSIRLWDFEVEGTGVTTYSQGLNLDAFLEGRSRLSLNADSTMTHSISVNDTDYNFGGDWNRRNQSIDLDALVPIPGGFVFEEAQTFEFEIEVDTLRLTLHKTSPCADILERPQTDCTKVFENSYYLEVDSVLETGYSIELTYRKLN